MEKEKAKKDVLGKDFLFMIVSILPVSLFRRNNLKSYPNIFSPNREITILPHYTMSLLRNH